MAEITCEFHFQEGFNGETVEVRVEGESCLKFEAKTRMQLGLARIETLQLQKGQLVSIVIAALGLYQDIRIGSAERWVTVNIADHTLVVRSVQEMPGYV